tara:strand:+ start:429 stop:1091 length:663 start_codon:yes stop_codon:yes gene_type:complete
MTDEKNIKQFAKAFIAAQTEMLNASKDSKNPFFKSKYADLTSVRGACVPALNKNGIGVLQLVVQVENKQYIKTILLHESGEEMSCLTEIMNVQNTPQAHGSGITYARRYGLQSIACIAAEDDDGNAASQGKTDGQKLAKSAAAAQNEIFKEQADKDFKTIKEAFEGAGSPSEIDALCETHKAKIAKFAKYDRVRYVLLRKTKEAMKLDLDPENEDDSLPM